MTGLFAKRFCSLLHWLKRAGAVAAPSSPGCLGSVGKPRAPLAHKGDGREKGVGGRRAGAGWEAPSGLHSLAGWGTASLGRNCSKRVCLLTASRMPFARRGSVHSGLAKCKQIFKKSFCANGWRVCLHLLSF